MQVGVVVKRVAGRGQWRGWCGVGCSGVVVLTGEKCRDANSSRRPVNTQPMSPHLSEAVTKQPFLNIACSTPLFTQAYNTVIEELSTAKLSTSIREAVHESLHGHLPGYWRSDMK